MNICGQYVLSSTLPTHLPYLCVQTIAGVADAINHIMEQYFASPANDLSDGFCEAGFQDADEKCAYRSQEPRGL
jgi:alcohol dehydrogenase YqhD (iron-dependent ADH family)